MSTTALQAINPAITDPNMIYAGESIYVPIAQHDNNASFAPSGATVGQGQFYVGGDYTSIDAISYITGSTQDQLLAANPGISLTDLVVGQALNLPSNPAIVTNYDAGTGTLTKTVDTKINGQSVNVTYTYDANGTPVAHVNTINGQPPRDQAAADAGFSKVTPGEVMFGDAGVDGTGVGGVVTANDATHPTGTQTLTTVLATTLDTLSLINAIRSGEPLPVVTSGLRLVNDINALNGVAPNYTISGAANVGTSIMSLMSLDAALKRGDSVAAITAGAQTLSYGAKAYMDFAVANGGSLPGLEIANSINDFLNTGPMIPGLANSTPLPMLNLVNSLA